MIEKSVSKQNRPLVTRLARDQKPCQPAVDIFETDEGLTLIADLPGLDEQSLQIEVEQGVLTIAGDVSHADGETLRREFSTTGYRRQFQLPESLDAGKAEAKIKHGVLTLTLPKIEAVQPKKIAVTVH